MSFSERKKKYQHIVDQLDEEYKEAAFWLPFEALRIKEVFSKQELEIVSELVDEMESATDDNERAARIAQKIDKYSSALVKLLKLSKVIA